LWSPGNFAANFDDASAQIEGYVEQVAELTQEVLGSVAAQTREVGERAANLIGMDVPKKDEAPAPAKKAPAKKAPAKKVTPEVTRRKSTPGAVPA
jgi:hypothetical protein